MAQRSEELVFGTGGQLLNMLKRVMGMLVNLRTLELRDLLLEGSEGLSLLDDVSIFFCLWGESYVRISKSLVLFSTKALISG